MIRVVITIAFIFASACAGQPRAPDLQTRLNSFINSSYLHGYRGSCDDYRELFSPYADIGLPDCRFRLIEFGYYACRTGRQDRCCHEENQAMLFKLYDKFCPP